MVRVSVIAAALIALGAGAARAQEQVTVPLADVARQAEAAKPNVKKAKKTYTNASLSADPRGETTATFATTTPKATADAVATTLSAKPSPPAASAAAADAKAAEGEPQKESEEAWRARAAGVRTQVDRLRARMADLTTPNKLRDENPGAKANNDTEVANTRTAVDALRKQWARIEALAGERKVPTAWIQPLPVFPQ